MGANLFLVSAGESMADDRQFSRRGTWLCVDQASRGRMLDMDRRLGPVRRASLGVLALALLICGPWLGWWTLAPLALAGAAFAAAERRTERSRFPEYLIFAAWLASQATIAFAVALAGGPGNPTMAWFAIPIVTLSARFSMRGVVWGVGFTLALIVAVAFGVDADAVLADPTLGVAPVALVIAVGMLSTALMRSDMEHRTEAVVDPLTGMLNRKALATRAVELTEQSAVSGEPIAVIVGDVDRFKHINDSLGHSIGDAVLRDVAYVLRTQLRAFDLVYRLGGEEFLVLLPGSDLEHAEAHAERLREALADASMIEDVRLTMSFGVSASVPGEQFDYEAVFARADAALYEAKHRGRDMVVAESRATSVAA
jgi:diguanylate cyclase (GGDEF)-like protein